MQKSKILKEKKNATESHNILHDLVKKNILGVDITDATKENILEYIVTSVEKLQKPYYIVTPNPEMIVLSSKNSAFQQVLNNAKLALNDGVGVGFAARFMGKPLKERFTGVELVEKLCEKVNDWPITVGFLGAGHGVAEGASECLKQKYPKLKVVFAQSEWDNSTKPIDILFVAFGFPKQELWMASHPGKIPVKVMAGVGGAFDYISGKVPRAPKLIRSIGMEWLFRLIVQPWRIKRQLALVVFIWMVIKERVSVKFSFHKNTV